VTAGAAGKSNKKPDESGRPMKIKINTIDFEVTAVPAGLRAAILTDPIVVRGVWRDVWAWDAGAGEGKALTQMVQGNAVPLGNGINFFVPRAGGPVNGRNEGPSRKMADRVLAAVGANSMNDLMTALNRIVHLPQKSLPLDMFAPLNPVASYKMRMYVDFAVLQLSHAGRNLSFYLLIPGQCAFHHEVTAITDQAGYDALIADKPQMKSLMPAFVVPPRTKANTGLRTLAVGQAITELQGAITAAGGPDKASDLQMARMAQLATEWRVLRSAEAANATPAPVGRA
jgi:hypothetical protein